MSGATAAGSGEVLVAVGIAGAAGAAGSGEASIEIAGVATGSACSTGLAVQAASTAMGHVRVRGVGLTFAMYQGFGSVR